MNVRPTLPHCSSLFIIFIAALAPPVATPVWHDRPGYSSACRFHWHAWRSAVSYCQVSYLKARVKNSRCWIMSVVLTILAVEGLARYKTQPSQPSRPSNSGTRRCMRWRKVQVHERNSESLERLGKLHRL